MGKSQASIEITASSSRLAAGLNAARQKFQTFAAATARGMGAAFKAINAKLEPGKIGKQAIGHMLGDMGSKGVGAILDTANSVRDFERNLVRYQIAASGSAESTAKLRQQIRDVSRATGIADAEILAGASSYVALTGDAKGASDAMTAFARISQASGSSVADVATATAALKQSLGIDGSQVEAAFSGLITQGKAGAVEIKDFAGELATLSPQFATFGKTGLDGLRDMGAAFQVIRQGAGTAGEAATQFQAVMGELVSSHKELKAIGVDVFHKNPKTGKRELRDFMSIAEDLAKNKALSDPARMAKIFGRKESQAAVRTIRDQIGAMRDLAKAGEDTGAVQRDLNTFLESDAGRLDKAFNSVKLAIAEAFTPERITAFVNAVEGLAAKLGPVVDFVGKIGDTLGGITGIGKSIRGKISGDGGRSQIEINRDRFMAGIGGAGIMGQGRKAFKGEFTEMQIAGAKSRLAGDVARAKAIDSILAGEKNERVTPESIRRAVAATMSARQYGQGKIEEQIAGEQYLRNAGVTPEERAKIEAELAKSIAEIPQSIREGFASALGVNLAPAPKIQIGDNAVAAATSNATAPRRGGK